MNKKKILVIEDDESVLNNIATLLEEENYEVATAANGQIGIEKAKEILPDLVICDIMMPVANGYDVLKELSKRKKTRNTPFIFLTAKVDRSDLRLGMELGADDYIFKPFERNELLNAVRTRLNKYEGFIADIINDKEEVSHDGINKKYDLDEKIFVSLNGKQMFLGINEIKYITAVDHYTSLKLANGKSVLMRHAIKNWEKALPENAFLRIHRSTMVNINYIEKMEKMHCGHKAVFLKDIAEPFIVSKSCYSKIRGKNK